MKKNNNCNNTDYDIEFEKNFEQPKVIDSYYEEESGYKVYVLEPETYEHYRAKSAIKAELLGIISSNY